MIFQLLSPDSQEVTKKIFNSIADNKSLLITYFNQHCFNVYYEDAVYKELIKNKFVAYQADHGIYFASKMLNLSYPERIDSTSLNKKVLQKLIDKNIPLAIIGGRFDESFILKKTKNVGINLVFYQDGFFEEPEIDSIVERLNDLDVRVIFVGMGVPKQELFAEKLSKYLKNKVIICVGIFFEFYFGTTKRAPVFIQKIGLEWMFRLLTEPKRLSRRYLIGIPVFFYRIFKIKLGKSVI